MNLLSAISLRRPSVWRSAGVVACMVIGSFAACDGETVYISGSDVGSEDGQETDSSIGDTEPNDAALNDIEPGDVTSDTGLFDADRDPIADAVDSDSGDLDGSDRDSGDISDVQPTDVERDTGADVATDPGVDAPNDVGVDTSSDTGVDADTGPVACAVSGRPGECIDVALCTGDRSPTPGLCPGASNIQCCTETPEPLDCDENELQFPNDGLSPAAGVGGCPPGMIPVADFCVHQYEAFVEVINGDETVSPWSPYHNPGDRRIRAVSAAGAVPQGYITGDQAAAACAESGARLCSDREWLRACQGSAGTTYPYGNTRDDGVCNDARTPHPVVEYFGTGADWIWSELGNACISQQDNTLGLTGDHDACVTEDGAFDMMGNLHEWTSDPAGTFRGGFYVDTVINGAGCLYRTTAHNTLHWDYSTGFRCCSDL